ncbi:hypothetical protein GC194_13465 [bacterium]|nr:hypothetical protein [bacterium]
MIKLLKSLLLCNLLLLLFFSTARAQEKDERSKLVKFGIGFKSVASSDLLSGGAATFLKNGVTFSFQPRYSMAIDAVVRFKLRDRFSFQTGITNIRRGYNYGMSTDTLSYKGYLRQPSFQIPFNAILDVPIAKNAKMGVEGGLIAEMIPGEVGSGNNDYYTYIYIVSRLKSSLRAGAHINFDLKNGSAIEVGFLYNRMLGRLGSFYMDYDPSNSNTVVSNRSVLQGHFFALNFLYFLP